jgi:hypothetical protein
MALVKQPSPFFSKISPFGLFAACSADIKPKNQEMSFVKNH